MPAGEVQTLSGRVNALPDPVALYGGACESGLRADTWILESADTTTASGTRSFIAARSALRAECRGNRVEVVALNDNGCSALEFLGGQIEGADLDVRADRLVAEFPAVADTLELTRRLMVPSPVNVLRAMSNAFRVKQRPHQRGFLVAGMFGYEFLDVYERLPEPAAGGDVFPDYIFWLPDRLVMVDHAKRNCQVIAHVFGGDSAEREYHDAGSAVDKLKQLCLEHPENLQGIRKPARQSESISTDIDDAQFAENVRKLKTHIINGDVYQVVASRTFTRSCKQPLPAYRRLRASNPSPYMFYFRAPRFTVFGASPETCLRVAAGAQREVEICPIAGTRARGRDRSGGIDADLDSRIEAELRSDDKEVAEHMMLVDLARNDIARVSEAGSMVVTRLLSVERYSHVMHLVSRVRGRLRAGLDCLHAYVAVMNMGTLVGAPKLKAAELLRECEKSRRGYYGGAVGYITDQGEMDTAIMIRSAFVAGGKASVRAGAGIVFDSDPASEARETLRKADAVLTALADDEVA